MIPIAMLHLLVALHARNAKPPGRSFEGLGFLPGGGYFSSVGAVSGDGTTVVGAAYKSGGKTAVRWQNDLVTDLGDVACQSWEEAVAVSTDGSHIAGVLTCPWSGNPQQKRGFIWSGGTMNLVLEQPSQEYTLPVAVSWDGSMVVGDQYCPYNGGCGQPGVPWPVRWVGGVSTPLGLPQLLPDVYSSQTTAASADCSVVVGWGFRYTPPTLVGWRWQDGKATEMGPPSDYASCQPLGISSNGEFVVGGCYSPRATNGFLWHAGKFIIIQLPGAPSLWAEDVSNDGSLVVGKYYKEGTPSPDPYHAVVWDAVHGARDLKAVLSDQSPLLAQYLERWHLSDAIGVSDDGLTIAGLGLNCAGVTEGWIARLGSPVPPQNGDVNCDHVVDINDLLAVIAAWGPCPGPPSTCPADTNNDEVVGIDDLLLIITTWGD